MVKNVRAEIARQDFEWWERLQKLADAGDLAGFWSTYAEYLEWSNIASRRRALVHKMAKRTAEEMRDPWLKSGD